MISYIWIYQYIHKIIEVCNIHDFSCDGPIVHDVGDASNCQSIHNSPTKTVRLEQSDIVVVEAWFDDEIAVQYSGKASGVAGENAEDVNISPELVPGSCIQQISE
jgi:hypothetical protein